MAYYWNPFAHAEFDSDTLVLQLPESGCFVRISGPVVEFLSQLPFQDVDEAVVEWQNRSNWNEIAMKSASLVWNKLCDLEVICSSDLNEELNDFGSERWVSLINRQPLSHMIQFMESQDFYGEEDELQLGA